MFTPFAKIPRSFKGNLLPIVSLSSGYDIKMYYSKPEQMLFVYFCLAKIMVLPTCRKH